MKYNETIFGPRVPIYGTNAQTPYRFSCGTRNISLESGFKSDTFKINEYLPDDLFYWEIPASSPYSALSFCIRTGTSGNYQYTRYNGQKSNMNFPIVLVTGNPKINSDFNFDSSGSTISGNSQSVNLSPLSTSKIKENNNSLPNWYYTETLPATEPSSGWFNRLPFILDFDYNNLALEILVGTSDSPNVNLATYISSMNTASNKICSIGINIYVGSRNNLSDANRSLTRNAAYDVDGNQIISASNQIGPLTDLRYNIPSNIAESLAYNHSHFSALRTFHSANAYALLFNGTCSTSANQYNISYLLEEDKWILDEGDTKYTLKKNGVNNIYSDDDFNYIRKLIAYLGFWFSDSNASISALLGENANNYVNENDIPDDVYQSEIKQGITTGKFYKLKVAKDNDQSKWGTDWRRKNGYEGRTPPTNTPSSTSSKSMYETSLTSFGTIYKCTKENIDELALALKNLVTDTQNPYDPDLFYGQNPVDCIINIKEYPIDITPFIQYTDVGIEPIYLGRWTPVVDPLDSQYIKYMARTCRICSSSTPFSYTIMYIPHKYKDDGFEFMDYEPYSVYHLYLPFCGTMKIPSELAVEHIIEVLYFVDLIAGSCIAHVYIDYKYYASSQGQLAVDVPVSGYQVSNYTRDMLNATYAQKQAYAGIAADVGKIISSAGNAGITLGITDKRAWGNTESSAIPGITAGNLTKLGGILSGMGSAVQAGADIYSKYQTIKYEKTILDHSAPAPIKSALGGGIINWESPYYVEMLVQRPLYMTGFNSEDYTALMGKSCYIADTLSNHSGGYVEAINCNLSGFPATQPEKVELAKLLADGVFL